MSGMKRLAFVAIVVLAQAALGGIASAGVIWLSETPPSKRALVTAIEAGDTQHGHNHEARQGGGVSSGRAAAPAVAGKRKHDHGGAEVDADGEVVADNTHSAGKQVWVRVGDDPRGSSYAGGMQGSLELLGQGGSLPVAPFTAENGLTTVSLKFSERGFYNAYLMQHAAHDDMLHVQIAKAELLYGTCCAKDVDEEAVAKPIVNASVPLELVREHYPGEGLFTRIISGDTVNFSVLSHGTPVAGAMVTMISHKGWRSSQASDADGRVSFTVIRDYYPSWLEFKKRFKQNYLVTAEWDAPDSVTFDGTTYKSAHYYATLAGNYYPSPHDYRSYAWGLGIALFVIVFGGTAIYLYRRRRLKPYKEVRVDAKV